MGWDALILMHYCGLNPMSPESGVARCGFPLINLTRHLQQLLDALFSVVGGSERGGGGAGRRLFSLSSGRLKGAGEGGHAGLTHMRGVIS